MKAGIGNGGGSNPNKVFVTMKVKNKGDADVNPHLEVYRVNEDSGKYEMVTNKMREIAGKFGGIDHAEYEDKDKRKKKKILIYLINEDNNEVYVLQTGMNGFGRNIMNCFVELLSKNAADVDMLSFAVYTKEDKMGKLQANLAIRHYNPAIKHIGDAGKEDMGLLIGWYFDWEWQKKLIRFREGEYADFTDLNNKLLDQWIKMKQSLEEEHPKYKRILDEYLNSEVKKSGYTMPPPQNGSVRDGAAASTPPAEEQQGHIVGEDEDDLPF